VVLCKVCGWLKWGRCMLAALMFAAPPYKVNNTTYSLLIACCCMFAASVQHTLVQLITVSSCHPGWRAVTLLEAA
jgi:hypothetical protein